MGIIESFWSAYRYRDQLQACRGRLYRVAYSWCHDGSLADDLVQKTLTKAYRKTDQLRDMDKLDSWLFRILANCWRDHLRATKPTEDIDNHILRDDNTPEDDYQRQQVVKRVQDAVARLPEGQRQVLTLVDLEGFSYAEVAEILDIPAGTVMSRISRARAALKERLMNNDYRPEPKERGNYIRRVK